MISAGGNPFPASLVRDADGTWQPAGQTGTIGREDDTYGALSYVDATVARFGGTPLALYAECAGPVGCKKIAMTTIETNVHYEGLGSDRAHREPPNAIVARIDELQSHVTIWQPSGEPLAETPSLLNATWDWGGGDWETALGAAAHMGRRDIAMFLLEQGARIDIFAAAMLGKTELVQAMLADNPALKHSLGPHGIPLLQHARAGGDEAERIVELLQN